jgi:hypothetical protein
MAIYFITDPVKEPKHGDNIFYVNGYCPVETVVSDVEECLEDDVYVIVKGCTFSEGIMFAKELDLDDYEIYIEEGDEAFLKKHGLIDSIQDEVTDMVSTNVNAAYLAIKYDLQPLLAWLDDKETVKISVVGGGEYVRFLREQIQLYSDPSSENTLLIAVGESAGTFDQDAFIFGIDSSKYPGFITPGGCDMARLMVFSIIKFALSEKCSNSRGNDLYNLIFSVLGDK